MAKSSNYKSLCAHKKIYRKNHFTVWIAAQLFLESRKTCARSAGYQIEWQHMHKQGCPRSSIGIDWGNRYFLRRRCHGVAQKCCKFRDISLRYFVEQYFWAFVNFQRSSWEIDCSDFILSYHNMLVHANFSLFFVSIAHYKSIISKYYLYRSR